MTDMDGGARHIRYAEDSVCPAGVVSPDEQLVRRLTSQVLASLAGDSGAGSPMLVPVGISARHAHVTQETLEVLYGPGASLTPYRDLRQPGNYAARETVTVVGPRMRALEAVRILGPVRNYDQVELSRTDGFLLGLSLPPRDSGDLEQSPAVTLVGPKGTVTLAHGAIRAGRHLHIPPEQAGAWGLADRQTVQVECAGDKALIFGNVLIRVGEGLVTELHLDTDDANAADLANGDMVRIIT